METQIPKTAAPSQNRPMWLIVLLLVVFVAIIFGILHYLSPSKNTDTTTQNSYGTATPTDTSTQLHSATTTGTTTSTSNIYTQKTSSSKGIYLADFNGMSLYTYSQDSTGVSNCTGSCASSWPPYTSGATAQGTFPANITVITRADGTKQFAWKGMPLYYFSSDTKTGDTTGDGVSGFSLAK